MSPEEHLSNIVAKCRELLAKSEYIPHYSAQADAGWRATIAAISWIQTAYISAYLPEREEAERVASEIIAAWPDELL